MSAGMVDPPEAATPEPPAPAPPTEPSAPPPPRHGLHWTGKVALAAAPLVFLALTWGTGAYVHSRIGGGETVVAPPGPANGPWLYGQHCARCHGDRGDGNGITHLTPPARYFGYEKFKFASTANAVPTDDDLLGLLRRGIPGTAMPGFANLSDAELRAIVDHVRRLTRAGIYARLYQKAVKDEEEGGDPPNPSALHAKAFEQSLPAAPLAAPGFADTGAPAPAAVANGRAVYEKACLSCHGTKGFGDGPQVATMKDELGRPIRPRNLTSGVYKGGGDTAHLYARIMLGIPGTPMPASTTLPAKDVQDLIAYIRSIVKIDPPAGGPVMQAAK